MVTADRLSELVIGLLVILGIFYMGIVETLAWAMLGLIVWKVLYVPKEENDEEN